MQEMRRHRAGAAMIVALALAGCDVPKEVNPVYIYRAISGEADAGRPPPPGLDRPRPNLASVPPRPDRPPPEVRDALSAALAADRARSREALARTRSARPLAGDPAWPAAPPPRAAPGRRAGGSLGRGGAAPPGRRPGPGARHPGRARCRSPSRRPRCRISRRHRRRPICSASLAASDVVRYRGGPGACLTIRPARINPIGPRQ